MPGSEVQLLVPPPNRVAAESYDSNMIRRRPPRYDRAVLLDVLIHHQRRDNTGCACGWWILGCSHAAHVLDVYEASITGRAPFL